MTLAAKQVTVRRIRQRVLRPLFKHQAKARIYATQQVHPALFMEMRLGKTVVAIRSLRDKKCERILVVAPLSVLPSWEKELTKEGQSFTNLRSGLLTGDTRWFLLNYEGLFQRTGRKVSKLLPAIVSFPWDAVVLDESARIRNPRSKTTQLLCRAFRQVRHRMVLSGLPAPEDPMEFCCQFLFLDSSFLGYRNYWDARHHLCRQVRYDWLPKIGVRGEIKKYVHDRAIVQLRSQVGMANVKIREIRTLLPTKAQTDLAKKIVKEMETEESMTKWRVVVETWLSRVAGGFSPEGELLSSAKAQEIVALLQGELRGQHVVIFCRFTKEIEYVQQQLALRHFRAVVLRGATPAAERGKIVDGFDRGDYDAIICQIKVAQFGLDLSRASAAIYYSNTFSYEERAQSEDRIEHPLKKEPLLLIDLVTEGSSDESVTAALQDKRGESRFFLRSIVQDIRRKLKCQATATSR